MVYYDTIIAIKLQAKPINILIMQVDMPTSEHEDDEVEDLCDINEEMLEEDEMGDTNTIIIVGWNSIIEEESYRNIAGPHDLRKKSQS